jgi:hypothetical protein
MLFHAGRDPRALGKVPEVSLRTHLKLTRTIRVSQPRGSGELLRKNGCDSLHTACQKLCRCIPRVLYEACLPSMKQDVHGQQKTAPALISLSSRAILYIFCEGRMKQCVLCFPRALGRFPTPSFDEETAIHRTCRLTISSWGAMPFWGVD